MSSSRLLGTLYDTVDDPASIPAFLAALEAATPPANNAFWCVLDGESNTPETYVSSMPDDAFAAYLGRLDEDPRFAALERLTPGSHLVVNDDLIDVQAFRTTDLHRDIVAQTDLESVLAGVIRQPGTSALLMLNRGRSSSEFDTTARCRHQALLAHFRRAVRLRLNHRIGDSDLPAPTFRVSAELRLIQLNARAEALLGRQWPLRTQRGRLSTGDAATDRRLARCARDAVDRDTGQLQDVWPLLRVESAAGRCLLWVLPGTRIRHDLTRERSALVVVLDPDGVQGADIASRYGLTAAETAVLRAILSGQTLTGYARQRHRSIHTVRTQLKSILHKVQASSQLDLVRRFARDVH